MNISYTRKGDYLLPNLILKEKVQYNIGKYGLLRLEYIKKYKLGLYFDLLVNDTLNEYLHNIDITVMEMVQKLINELAEKENITEELKSSNQMLWIDKMNNIKDIADEISLKEYIYV
ncbi:MAG: TnpV protein [bacterium]|nr:TnpV protein [bacterium]